MADGVIYNKLMEKYMTQIWTGRFEFKFFEKEEDAIEAYKETRAKVPYKFKEVKK